MSNHTYSLLFYLKKDPRTTINTARILSRITVNGKRAELSVKRSIEPERWDSKHGQVKGNKEDAREINSHLDHIKLQLNRIHNKITELDQQVTAQKIKDLYTGVGEIKKTLKQVFDYHNTQMKSQIGKDFAKATYVRYETTQRHIQNFLQYQYKIEDLGLLELKYSFITDLEYYFKTVRNCNHNTAVKYIKNFRKIINLAVDNDWLEKDPFSKFQCKLKEVKREYLTKDELHSIEEMTFAMERLDQVRDVFVFCCYTGLAHTDVEKLTPDNISKGLDGEYWIFVDRSKTGNPSNIPLLPRAAQIIEKYKGNPQVLNVERLLPVISNQKMNAYLKEIANLCGVNKNITFHMARHTFATTVTLSNGVAIETVSAMMGHKNLKTTQIYAKVVQEKVSEDMKALKTKLSQKSFEKVYGENK